MGRSSGYIAMHASLASGQIDICLIPEVPFHLHGPHGVLRHLKYLIETKGSAVVCVAEGAGQNFLEKTNAKDASGNIILGDIGVHIQQEEMDDTQQAEAEAAVAAAGAVVAAAGDAVAGAGAGAEADAGAATVKKEKKRKEMVDPCLLLAAGCHFVFVFMLVIGC